MAADFLLFNIKNRSNQADGMTDHFQFYYYFFKAFRMKSIASEISAPTARQIDWYIKSP